MKRHLSSIAAVALTATLGLGLSAPVHADDGYTEAYNSLEGLMTWVTLGHVAGQPGNAHSGSFSEDSGEGDASFELMDWRCPRGVIPPNGPDTSGPCDLVRDRSLYGSDPTMAESGPLALSVGGTWHVDTSWWQDGQPVSGHSGLTTIALDVVRVGPLQRTDSYPTDEWDTTYSARMQLRGTILDVHLPSSRSSQTSNWSRVIVRFA